MKMGRLVAVCMSATKSGEGVSEVISQAVPTLCIQVPMLETTVAIQIDRKSAWRSGLQAETPGGLFEGLGFFTKFSVLNNY
jgi:hypothetical protein